MNVQQYQSVSLTCAEDKLVMLEEERRLTTELEKIQNELESVKQKLGKHTVKVAVPGKKFSSHLSQDQSEHVTDEVFNAASHLTGALLSILGTAYLISESSYHKNIWEIVSFSIYGIGMINLFVTSTLHHGLHGSNKFNKILRMLDFNAIYPMIAGTYTPLCVIYLHQTVVGWVFVGCVWSIALLGMVVTILLFPDHLPKWVPFVFYITMGWMSVFLVLKLVPFLRVSGMLYLVAGGFAYTAGGIVYTTEIPAVLIKDRFGFHEIWHICVLVGAGCHFALMCFCVLPDIYS